MNRVLLMLSLCLLLTSCRSDSDDPLDGESLYGTWLLSDVLLDPGDGSGTFTPTDSGEQLILRPEGTFIANWNPCGLEGSGDDVFEGAYLETSTMSFEISCSVDNAFTVQGSLEDSFLLLFFPCIEPCVYRFYKTGDL